MKSQQTPHLTPYQHDANLIHQEDSGTASPRFYQKSLAIALISCLSLSAYAETQYDEHTHAHALDKVSIDGSLPSAPKSMMLTPPANTRMGDWLVTQLGEDKSVVNTYLTPYYESALVWQSAIEQQQQWQAKQVLNSRLTALATKRQSPALRTFTNWIASLPATGRVVLPKQDPRYLQVNPSVDPVFAREDKVRFYQRPDHITVLFDDAQTCQVAYKAGVRSLDYIDTCTSQLNKHISADAAYLISPSGTVNVISLANWNAKQQPAPNAGAWLWVPDATHQWSEDLAWDVAQFLSTQGIGLTSPYTAYSAPLPLTNSHFEDSRDLPLSASDWGITGLLQTPTARMQKQGTAGFHVSHVDPYTQYNLVLQPFDWLETAVRYTNIDGVSYGTVSPDQDLKDKSLDVKLRLANERKWIPEMAVGWRDPAGTSLFGGEYLVANKRYGDFDFSLGMGWGYLGARGDIDNPLARIDDRFENRVADKRGQGGELSPKSWFTGPSALFGGVQWHSPYEPLTLKIEYDGNDYESEPYSDKDYNSNDIPVNVGITWQDKDRGVALSAGVERGDALVLGLSMQGDLSQLGQVKPKAHSVQAVATPSKAKFSNLRYHISFDESDDPLSAMTAKPHLNGKHQEDIATGQSAQSALADNSHKNQQLLNAFSQATGWLATELSFHNGIMLLKVESDDGAFVNERLQQGMEILSQIAPANTRLIQIQNHRYGEAVSTYHIHPQTWSQRYQQLLPPSQREKQPIAVTASTYDAELPATSIIAKTPEPKGSITFAPKLYQSVGGPDGYLFGLYANANAEYRLWDGAWVNLDAQARLADNFDKYTYTADSKLPRVRTNIKEYMTTSRVLMPNLQVTQFKPLGNNFYGLGYAGYIDPMYAGVGGEILYRKPNTPWAVGVDINQVRQREFDQHFELQDYEVTTGHVSLYWDVPWKDIDMKLSAGQYLAGDKGVTLDLSRTFNNGVKMGGWATKTDVSAEDFGEGSMDKGIYLSLPFDTLFKSWASGNTRLVYQPLIRDGGAQLNRKYQLYDLTAPIDDAKLEVTNPLGQ